MGSHSQMAPLAPKQIAWKMVMKEGVDRDLFWGEGLGVRGSLSIRCTSIRCTSIAPPNPFDSVMQLLPARFTSAWNLSVRSPTLQCFVDAWEAPSPPAPLPQKT